MAYGTDTCTDTTPAGAAVFGSWPFVLFLILILLIFAIPAACV
ncbi:hypothetical protein Dtox_3849 [Desulfofarcimen acetoxidans DSM 771]|jgi:hypothetical protein|uniref:Uncharacterized protein n=1 Tax=Desulfofarcimen acetoxidans (strain ATCC 49208 / DSM 771 / KCTC 5769 / VKM B-1644 / 5575) TaxID=485916 RepID=C8VXF7_DESAS|nr:hypothetical protein [Desulfofarcimen acetoxidans]ACV64553.1 hypothetical protein Dtox_3849 [Desulfofarcimen acetoxidans DSM 771]